EAKTVLRREVPAAALPRRRNRNAPRLPPGNRAGLVHDHLEAALGQLVGGAHPGDPSTQDDDLHLAHSLRNRPAVLPLVRAARSALGRSRRIAHVRGRRPPAVRVDPMAESRGTVLVTGGSGFLGGWCVVELLRRGYAVKATVRSPSREAQVRAAVGAEVDPEDRLAVLAADLMSDEGWPEAVDGCDYILHVASPFPPKQPRDPDELIRPAREGTLRVLA